MRAAFRSAEHSLASLFARTPAQPSAYRLDLLPVDLLSLLAASLHACDILALASSTYPFYPVHVPSSDTISLRPPAPTPL